MSKSFIEYDSRKNLSKYGVLVGKKIAKTLQGSLYRGILKNGDEDDSRKIDIVIKRTNLKLYKNKLGRLNDGEIIAIDEDINKEIKIMKYIQSLNPSKGFLKVYGTIQDDCNWFSIIEYGGKSLFDHVKKYHKLIELNKLNIDEWKKHVKIIFGQLVKMIYFLHNKAKVCHMDISLENILIKGCIFTNGKFTSHGQVSICDFGLSEYFGNNNFMCAKFVGKTIYQAPEVFSKRQCFDARKGDIWSLGICLFILQIGLQPLNKPCMKDNYFRNIINGHLATMVHNNNKSLYISKWFLFIINNILTLHQRRWSINIIANAIFS